MKKDKMLSLYVGDKKIFLDYIDEIKFLWFSKFKESLPKYIIILKALIRLKTELEAVSTDDTTGQDIHRFKRIGL